MRVVAEVVPEALRSAVRALGLSGKPVCVHSSLASMGNLQGGAGMFIDAFLAEDCTLLVPTFSWDAYAALPPEHLRPQRNGWDYSRAGNAERSPQLFVPSSLLVDRDMGAIPAAVVNRSGRQRGDHPLASFSAVGRLARSLVEVQRPDDAFAPLERLAEKHGSVLLVGVDLRSMTLLHLAERRAGRVMPRRWALDKEGQISMVEVGGCSEGFAKLEPLLASTRRVLAVGPSLWQVFDAGAALEVVEAAIRQDPEITVCGDPSCVRCRDAVLGGPILDESN